MKFTARHAVAAVLTAAVAVGLSAPAASAAPKDKPAHVKTQGKGKATASAKKAAAAQKKAAVAAKKYAAQQRQVLQDIGRRDAALARVVEGDRLDGLADSTVTAITGNVAADRAALAEIRALVAAGGQDLRKVRVQLHSYRVETYNVVVGIARDTLAVAEEAAANDVALADLAASGVDVTEAQAANTAAVEAADSALAKALLLTATSDVRARAHAEADLAAAWEHLAVVAAFIESHTTEEPAETA